MYLIHSPIVWLSHAWMLRWSLHWSLHWSVTLTLILLITGVLLLTIYHYLVRNTFIGVFLNERKYPRSLTVASTTPDTSRA